MGVCAIFGEIPSRHSRACSPETDKSLNNASSLSCCQRGSMKNMHAHIFSEEICYSLYQTFFTLNTTLWFLSAPRRAPPFGRHKCPTAWTQSERAARPFGRCFNKKGTLFVKTGDVQSSIRAGEVYGVAPSERPWHLLEQPLSYFNLSQGELNQGAAIRVATGESS